MANQQMNNPSMNPFPTPGGNVPFSHGGHEVLDLHEVLSGLIGQMEQYMLYKEHIQDQELMTICQNQSAFMNSQYNIMVEAFSTGKDPSMPTSSYKMNQSNEVTYGLTPSQPSKPKQSVSELDDKCISSFMMGLAKANATAMTTASLEATNPVVRRVLADSIPNFIEMAYELFLYQNKNGYYQVPQLAQQDMQQILNSFAKSPMQGQPGQNNLQ
nr:spore coat protein [Virgibacillus sp. MSP4-1]